MSGTQRHRLLCLLALAAAWAGAGAKGWASSEAGARAFDRGIALLVELERASLAHKPLPPGGYQAARSALEESIKLAPQLIRKASSLEPGEETASGALARTYEGTGGESGWRTWRTLRDQSLALLRDDGNLGLLAAELANWMTGCHRFPLHCDSKTLLLRHRELEQLLPTIRDDNTRRAVRIQLQPFARDLALRAGKEREIERLQAVPASWRTRELVEQRIALLVTARRGDEARQKLEAGPHSGEPLVRYLRAYADLMEDSVAGCRRAAKEFTELKAKVGGGLVGLLAKRLGDALICQGDPAAAIEHFEEAVERYATEGAPRDELSASIKLANAQLRGRAFRKAYATARRATQLEAITKFATEKEKQSTQHSIQELWAAVAERGRREVEYGRLWRYRFHGFSERAGLASNLVNAIGDLDGKLMFLTHGGVSLFDGVLWTHLPHDPGLPAGATVRSYLKTPTGDLWFGTDRGAVRCRGNACRLFDEKDGLPARMAAPELFDAAGGVWLLFPWAGEAGVGAVARFDDDSLKIYEPGAGLDVSPQLEAGAVSVSTTVAEAGDGSIWVLANTGLFRLNGERFDLVGDELGLSEAQVHHVASDADGTLWIGSSQGICVYRTGACQHLTAAEGLPSFLVVDSLARSSGGRWLLATEGLALHNGLHKEGRIAATYPFTGKWDVSLDYGAFVEASDGAVWFLTRKGVVRFSNGNYTVFGAEEGLPASGESGQSMIALHQAPGGWLWIGAYGDGVGTLAPAQWRVLDARDGIPDHTVQVLHDGADGSLWIGTWGGGLTHRQERSMATYTIRDGLMDWPDGYIRAIAIDKRDAVWVATDLGLSRLLDDQWSHFTIHNGLPGVTPYALLPDQKGNLWVASDSGLARFDGELWHTFSTEHGLPHNAIRQLLESADGDIWLGTVRGLARIPREYTDGLELNVRSYPNLSGGGRVQELFEEKPGVLWLGTSEEGARRCDITDPTQPKCQAFTLSDGLPSNTVNAIAANGRGQVVLGTQSGICIHDGDNLQCETVGRGLPVAPVTDIHLTRKGQLVVGTTKAAAIEVRPPAVGSDTVLVRPDGAASWRGPKASGESANRYLLPASQARSLAERAVLAGHPFALPAGRPLPTLEVRSHGATFEALGVLPMAAVAADEFFYSFRVDDGPWSAYTHDAHFALFDLANGMHVVHARSKSPDLVVDATPATVRVRVAVPWPWYLTVGLALLGLMLPTWQHRRLAWLYQRWRHRRFRPIIPSPFVPNRPAEGDLFVDRRSQIDAVESLARTGGGVAALWGGRGNGKLSLVRKLGSHLRARRMLVVELDLASATAGGDLAELVTQMSHGFTAVLEASGYEQNVGASVSLPDSPAQISETLYAPLSVSLASAFGSGDRNPFTQLSLGLERLEQVRPDVRVAFLLSNAEILSMALESDAAYGSYLFPFFRSLAQQRSNTTVVLAMRGKWFELAKRFELLFTFATPIAVGRLTDTTSRRLLVEPLRGKALLPPEPLARLLDLAGGQPSRLQLLGDRLSCALNAAKTNVATPPLVEQVAAEVLSHPDARLEAEWLDLSREERIVVVGLCECGHQEGRRASLEEVVGWLARAGSKLLLEEARRAVLALDRDGTLKLVSGVMSIQGDLFRQWVRAHHTVASVLDESYDYVGHYQLQERLGTGGMGVVYRARDMVHGDTVAVKLLRPELSENRRSRRRFLREAKLGRRLNHPNIVHILDYGEQAGRLYLAMEYLEGLTLTRWVRRYPPPTSRMVVEVGMHLASALAAIHRLGIVHRDVKGENVMILGGSTSADAETPGRAAFHPGAIKLMDFGLAVGESVSRMTREGSVLGTIAYMPPEQALGKEVDTRSDLYSLGAVLFELCCGQPPFAGVEAAALNAVVNDPPPSLQKACPEIPEAVAALIEQLLAKDADKRPQTAIELEERLRELAVEIQADEVTRGVRVARMREARRREREARAGPSRQIPHPSGISHRSLETIRAENPLISGVSSRAGDSAFDANLAVTQGRDRANLLLYRIAAAVAQRTAGDEMLKNCLADVAEAFAAERGVVVLLRDSERLRCAATYERVVSDLGHVPLLLSLLQQSIGDQMGLLYKAEPGELEHEMGSAVCAPLWAGKKILGAILLDRIGLEAERFEEAELELLASVGYLVGLGLERENLNRQILNQERLAVIGRMLTGVAHDLRNPMAVISGYAQLLTGEPDKSLQQEACDHILNKVEEMSRMIGDLLSFSRGEHRLHASEARIVDLAKEVRATFCVLCEPRGIEFTVEAQGETASIDVGRAKRIIYNLAKNSLEVISRGGSLTVELRVWQGGLEIKVTDSGPGIPEKSMANLFQPFVSTGKAGGTGLGLAIVKRFVDDHGGTVDVDSAMGQGTTFTVRLPYKAP